MEAKKGDKVLCPDGNVRTIKSIYIPNTDLLSPYYTGTKMVNYEEDSWGDYYEYVKHKVVDNFSHCPPY